MTPSTKTLLLLTFVATLSAVDAGPLVGRRSSNPSSLDFTTHLNANKRSLTIAELDRARAQAIRQAGRVNKRDHTSLSIANNFVAYTAQVGIGEPATDYTLLIDTGSANTWVGADKKYVHTKSSIDTGKSVSTSYGSGEFSGEEWLDTVRLTNGLVIKNQSIGVAKSSHGLQNVDGILGVGPVDLTSGTVNDTDTVPTVSNNLYAQKTISEEVLGVYFVPASESNHAGKLTFGGYDDNVITSPVQYVPLTTTSPASNYWGIDQSVTYGGETILETTAGIVDTGTTLVLLATDAFQKYKSATGGVEDSATGLLVINATQYANLKTLSFHVGDACYDLSPNAQIWPRSLNSQIGGNSSAIYLIVSDIGSKSGSGLDVMNGYTFLERYYSVFDTTHGRVGFASTAHTKSETN